MANCNSVMPQMQALLRLKQNNGGYYSPQCTEKVKGMTLEIPLMQCGVIPRQPLCVNWYTCFTPTKEDIHPSFVAMILDDAKTCGLSTATQAPIYVTPQPAARTKCISTPCNPLLQSFSATMAGLVTESIAGKCTESAFIKKAAAAIASTMVLAVMSGFSTATVAIAMGRLLSGLIPEKPESSLSTRMGLQTVRSLVNTVSIAIAVFTTNPPLDLALHDAAKDVIQELAVALGTELAYNAPPAMLKAIRNVKAQLFPTGVVPYEEVDLESGSSGSRSTTPSDTASRVTVETNVDEAYVMSENHLPGMLHEDLDDGHYLREIRTSRGPHTGESIV